MINKFVTKYSPPGMDLKQEKKALIWGIAISAIYSSFYFFARYTEAINELYEHKSGKPVLNVNAAMPNFRSLLGFSFIGFAAVAIIMLSFIIYRYIYYRQGSMSIYLMKRLPKKAEIHRRALILPLFAVILCFITAFILLMLYFAIYMLATPKACLSPNQWQILWRLF